jgi:LAO/AO transport system kinase
VAAASVDVAALEAGIVAGERRSLAKAITLIESTRPEHRTEADALLERILPRSGKATRLGITGVPGVGKSTFIEAFGLFLLDQGHRVAVLAVDPSSSISGGSILGDKTRMPSLAVADNAFIRPSPSRGSLGGVASHTREAMLLCEAAGYDVILVETVGVGQSEYVVASMVDFFLVLMLAGAGDELQGIKRGILELADALAVNKADGDNVQNVTRASAEYQAALHLVRGNASWVPPVIGVSALKSKGMDQVWNIVQDYRKQFGATGDLEKKRADQRHRWFWSLLDEGLKRRFLAKEDVSRAVADAERAINAGEVTATVAARRILNLV